MPEIYLFNGTLAILQDNSNLLIQLVEEQTSDWLIVISIGHLIIKIGLLGLMIHSFRQANNKLSLSFAYVIIGWELQAHLIVIRVF